LAVSARQDVWGSSGTHCKSHGDQERKSVLNRIVSSVMKGEPMHGDCWVEERDSNCVLTKKINKTQNLHSKHLRMEDQEIGGFSKIYKAVAEPTARVVAVKKGNKKWIVGFVMKGEGRCTESQGDC